MEICSLWLDCRGCDICDTNGFAAREQYHAWFADHEFLIQYFLSIQKEAGAVKTNGINGRQR
jgi:hypothetical protein